MRHYVSEPFRVRFSETDMAGVVHFSQILRWAENAESEFFRKQGLRFIGGDTSAGTLFGWPRVRVACDFISPVRYDEIVRVRLCPSELPAENASAISWKFDVVVGDSEISGRVAARGSWTDVFARVDAVEKIMRAERVPESVRKILNFFGNSLD